MRTRNADIITRNSVFLWLALATGLILLIPLVAMQFTDEVVWTLSDFMAAGVLLFGAGGAFVLAARRLPRHRLIVGVVVVAALLWLWAELAVGVFTNWGS
jgi:hypothetical protein